MNADVKFKKMTETPVPKLVITLAIPTIISMLISAIYNMADTFFVGKIGTSATGAVGISFSLMAILQAVGFTIGMGSGNYISRLLGEKNTEYASKVAATSFFTSFIVGIIITITSLIFLDPLVNLLGATPTIFPYAKAYIGIILLGAPFIISSFVLNNIIRFQGSAFYAMFGIGFGGLLNIILDPIFIFVLEMGTGGAALATVISQICSFIILLYVCGKGGNIKIKFRNFHPRWAIYKEVLRTGLPSFYRQGLLSLAMMTLNQMSRPYGDSVIAAMSIVGRAMGFAFSALIGLGQGFQPVCGFNYGAKRYDRVIEAFWFCVKVAFTGLLIASIAGIIFAPQIISIFRKDDPEVIAVGARVLRLHCIPFPLSAWVVINNMLMQNIGKSKEASILSFARQGLFYLPLILTLPRLIGIWGIQLSQPIADVLTFCLALPMGFRVIKEVKFLSNQKSDIRSG
ncbi:MAG: MATE family efflux transporter [Clostridiaceae bacterium]|nr:MATE family efflux transporter [Clostridiaceae bacterium]